MVLKSQAARLRIQSISLGVGKDLRYGLNVRLRIRWHSTWWQPIETPDAARWHPHLAVQQPPVSSSVEASRNEHPRHSQRAAS